MYKQVIIVRSDLGMSLGKISAQSAHASLRAWEKSDKKIRERWDAEGGKTVVLKIKNKEELLNLYNKAKKMKLPTALIKDAGLTEVPPSTITCLGVGPAFDKDIDKLTGSLKLLK